MKPAFDETLNDLNLLIDISCINSTELPMFEQFHKLLIALTYKATDVKIEYNRKRVHMKLLFEDENQADLMLDGDEIPYHMTANLSFTDLNSFLKLCAKDEKSLILYYPILKDKFLKNHSSPKEYSEAIKFIENNQ